VEIFAYLAQVDRAAREQMARQLDNESGETKGMRDQFHRLKAIEEAVALERDPAELLN
jgi:hypothetical protein